MRACAFVVLALIAPFLVDAQQTVGWRLRPDATTTDTVAFDQMPPGWHLTTPASAGVVVFDPANIARGRFAVSLEVFLFPGQSQDGYGLFLGGADLDGDRPSYLAFTARRDGRVSVVHVLRADRRVLVDWLRNEAVTPHPGGDDAQRNTLRVSVEQDSLRFEANGTRVTALARGDLAVDGVFGLRAGRNMNLHVSNLDYTVRLAPPPRPRRP